MWGLVGKEGVYINRKIWVYLLELVEREREKKSVREEERKKGREGIKKKIF